MPDGGGGGPLVIAAAAKAAKVGESSSLKSLGLAVLKITGYMGLGVLLYTFPEINVREPDPDGLWDWDFVDCIYFTMVTITTVGYGDMITLSQEMRIVTAIFGIVGVVQIAGSLNVIADWFVERARKRFMAKQRVVLQEAQAAGALVRDEEFTAAAPGGAPGATLAPAPAPAPARPKGAASAAAQAAADGATEMTEQQPAAKDDPPLPTPGHRQAPTPPPSPPGGAPAGASSHKPAQVVPVGNDAIAELVKNEQSRAAEEAMNAKEEKPRFLSCPDRKMLYAMFMALLPCLIFIVSCFVLAVIENFHFDCYNTDLFKDHAAIVADDRCWTLPVDAFYYAIITLSTIGYGDVTPHSTGGKLLATFLIPFAIISLTNFIGKMADIKSQKKMGMDKTLRERLEELNAVIEADDNGIVTPEEYILFNLKQMGKVDDDTVNLLRDQFAALDADGSGELDAADLALLQKACEMIGGSGHPPERSRPATPPAS